MSLQLVAYGTLDLSFLIIIIIIIIIQRQIDLHEQTGEPPTWQRPTAAQGQPSLLVSLDMSAAFDTIDHSILLNRLLVGFGVYGGSALTWLQSYFTDRYQCVRDARQSLLSDCLSALHSWFCHNGLALNSSKSESILIGTRQRLCTSRSG